jgi:hypothetical protein
MALLFLQQELCLHFPTLQWLTWVNALLTFQPDLWVADSRVYLDYEDLTHLTQYLATSPELPQLEPPVHGPRAGYLSKRLVTYQDRAITALADIEANPQAYGYHVQALVTELALGNAVADEVFLATQWGRRGRRHHPDRAAARETVQDRVLTLQRASWENTETAGPDQ